MGAFNLVAGATAPWFIFPQLGIGGLPAFIGLVLIPVIFSVLFLAAPVVRRLSVRRENSARQKRNVRRAVLSLAYGEALGKGDSVTVDAAYAHVRDKLGAERIERSHVEEALHELASEFDADVLSRPDGALGFRFPAARRQFLASEAVRRDLRLEEQTLGSTVYSTADTTAGADARDLANFDRQLAAQDADLSGYLSSPGRVGFEADYEVVAFDEELQRRGALKA